jgi:transcription termination factor Rho
MFENLTPLFPKEQMRLERDNSRPKRTSPAA